MVKASLPIAGKRESVFFDLDGVVIRSHLAILRCINETLRVNDLQELGEDEGLSVIGSPVKAVFIRAIGSSDGSDARVRACVAGFRYAYERSFMDGTTLQPGMRDVLEQAAARVPIALATTKPGHIADAILTELGVRPLFTIVAGPGASADGETKDKTLARGLDELARANPIANEARKSLMVGDRHHDIEAARANGLPVAGVLWGYGSREELAPADAIVEDSQELSDLIRYGASRSEFP